MVRGRALPFAARLFENEEPPPQVREFCRARLLRTCPNKGACPWRAPLKATRQDAAKLVFPILPAVAAPIPAAFMFAEGDAGTGSPVIFVDDHPRGGWVVVPLVDVPTDVAATDNGCRRGHRRRGQNGRASGCAEQHFGN